MTVWCSQDGQVGQRHVAVAIALAFPDVQEHALGVDVADAAAAG